MVGYDFTGYTFTAHIKSQPGLATAALLAITVALSGATQTVTYQSLVTSCTIHADDIPCGKVSTDTVAVSTLLLTASKAAIQALPAASDVRQNFTLYWDLKSATPIEEVLLAGEFFIVPGMVI